MQLPLVSPAPLVSEHASAFRHLFNDARQYGHFQNYLTGLIVLDNKSLTNISRCILDSADKTNLSRFMSVSPWDPSEMNRFRVKYMLEQTVGWRQSESASCLILDDTLCAHVGSLFEYVERHYDHCDGSYPLSHNLVTSHYLSGAVRFPIDFELYRRYESLTQWELFVRKHFPEQVIPTKAKERQSLHKKLDSELLKDPEFARLHGQFCSKVDIAKRLLKQAINQGLAFTTLLIDSWYLSSELVKACAEAKKDWVSIIKRNRNLECSSIHLKDAKGQPVILSGDQIKVEALVPLIPATAYRQVTVAQHSYWCFTLTARITGLGKVRLVISFDNPELTGTYAVLLTNRTDWSAAQILAKYLQRWPIETFYRDSKQHLGLGEYRTRTFAANEAHWSLVFVAYSLLHLAALPPSSTKGSGQRPKLPSQTIGEVCRQQAQVMIERVILFAHDLLQKGEPAAQVFASLFAKQHKAVCS